MCYFHALFHKQMHKADIPRKTIYRLSIYNRALQRLRENSVATVSSEALATAAGVKPTQLRKDLDTHRQRDTEYQRLVRLRADGEARMKVLNEEISTMKKNRVELKRRLEAESKKREEWRVTNNRELARLRKEARAAQIEAVQQAAGATDLDGALTRARTLLAGEPGEVLVFTDGSGPGNVARASNSVARLLATGSALIPRSVGVATPANLVVTDARYGDGLEGGTVTLTVRNYGSNAVESPATVELPDVARMTVFVQAPGAAKGAPGEATSAVTVPRQAAGGVAVVTVADPGLLLDDARYFHLPRVGQSRVLVVDGDPGSSPTKSEVYFLERALAPFAGAGAALAVVAPAGALQLAEGKDRVAVLANLGDPTQLAPTLVDFVRGGGALVLSVGDNVSASVWNSALSSLLPAPLTRTRDLVSLEADEGMPLVAPELGIDLFEPFDRGGRLGFERIRSRRIFAVEGYSDSEDVRTLLRYQGGAPALIERRIGAGRVLLWTSTIDVGWSNFPLQSTYAPFWARLVAWLGGEVGSAASRMNGEVGEPLSVSVPAGESFEVTGPKGERVGVSRLPGAVAFTPETPGAYAIGRSDEPPVAWVAVNTPASESDIRADESFEEAKARIDPERARREVPLDALLVLVAAVALVAAAWLGAAPIEDREELPS